MMNHRLHRRLGCGPMGHTTVKGNILGGYEAFVDSFYFLSFFSFPPFVIFVAQERNKMGTVLYKIAIVMHC